MFDPYHKWLGIPSKEQPPNHYRLLGVDLFENDLDVIEGAADKQMGFVRQYQSGENAADAARVLNELALARLCLLKPDKKSEYDAKLRKKIAVPAKPDPEAAFAEMPLPKIPSSSIVELPKRKRKSRKSQLKVPPKLVGIAVAGAIVLVAIQFIPKGAINDAHSDVALAPEQPATPAVAPPQTIVTQAEASAPPISQNTTQRADAPSPIVAASELDATIQQPPQRPVEPTESKPNERPAAGKIKSTTTTLDPSESISVENELVGGTGGNAMRFDLKGKTMVGVDWQPGEWFGSYAIKQMIPIAAGAPLNPDFSRATAPKGYAVGAIKVNAPKYVSSVQLVYMKINEDGSLDPSETKLSKWLGMKPKGEITTLSGEGKRLVGLQYRRAIVVDAIGILVEQ